MSRAQLPDLRSDPADSVVVAEIVHDVTHPARQVANVVHVEPESDEYWIT